MNIKMKLIEKQKEYMVLYHNNKYKDVSNRERKRVYGIISQQIADIIPEAVSTQKGTLYDIYTVILNVMQILFI
jgi:hypothetical protein